MKSGCPYTYSMDNVINFIRKSEIPEAVSHFMGLLSINLIQSEKAVAALRPYLDPTHPRYGHGADGASEAITEPFHNGGPNKNDLSPKDLRELSEKNEEPTKPDPRKKWMVTAYDANTGADWNQRYTEISKALNTAQRLCRENYTSVCISEIIAEAVATTTYKIEL